MRMRRHATMILALAVLGGLGSRAHAGHCRMTYHYNGAQGFWTPQATYAAQPVRYVQRPAYYVQQPAYAPAQTTYAAPYTASYAPGGMTYAPQSWQWQRR